MNISPSLNYGRGKIAVFRWVIVHHRRKGGIIAGSSLQLEPYVLYS